MKKSTFWILLIIAISGTALLTGLFIGRVTSGDRIHTSKAENETEPENEIKPEDIGLLDINTATIDQLSQLPGIGVSLAKRIIDYRQNHGPFQNISELLDVPGIGEVKFNGIKHLIKTGGQK